MQILTDPADLSSVLSWMLCYVRLLTDLRLYLPDLPVTDPAAGKYFC